jgi:hypothetical protein
LRARLWIVIGSAACSLRPGLAFCVPLGAEGTSGNPVALVWARRLEHLHGRDGGQLGRVGVGDCRDEKDFAWSSAPRSRFARFGGWAPTVQDSIS